MKKYFQLFIKKRWHLHSLALLINFVYFYFGNQHSFMGIDSFRWQGIKGTEYIFQPFLSLFLTFCGAIGWEIYQGFKGANKTDKEWRENAIPDIIATTILGFFGFLLELAIFEYNEILNYL